MSLTGEESEEEELYIYVESHNTNIDKYRSIHVLGINEKSPIVQMDDTFFIGKYENALGTYMFFEEDPSPTSEDPLFDKLADVNVKYLTKTRKLLRVEQAYVTSKDRDTNTTTSGLDLKPDDKEADEFDSVCFKSIPEALDKFKSVLVPVVKEMPAHDLTVENRMEVDYVENVIYKDETEPDKTAE